MHNWIFHISQIIVHIYFHEYTQIHVGQILVKEGLLYFMLLKSNINIALLQSFHSLINNDSNTSSDSPASAMFVSGHPHYRQDGWACSVMCTLNRPLAVILVTLGQAFVNCIMAIKLRSTRWAEHLAWIQKREMHKIYWLEDLKERYHLEDLGINRRIILKWILETEREGMDRTNLA